MIKYICFYPNQQEGIYPHIKLFFETYFNNNKKYLIIGPYVTLQDFQQIKSIDYDIKILVIFEPIQYVEHYKLCYNIFQNYKKYNLYLFGCVENKPEIQQFKFPLYMMERFPIYNNPTKYFLETNQYIQNTDILSKKFCCLINSWDPENHREKIYNILTNIDSINCPGILLNNCSNNELNKIGKTKYINQFIFNICSENYDNTLKGYITEKLMDCCLGGAIPIYAGSFDEYDEQIFNKNRIIFYNSQEEKSYIEVYKKIKSLFDNKDKLIEFYKQPVFCENASKIIQDLENNFKNI